MAKFKVMLGAVLPTSASMIVDALDQDAAEQYADENFSKADWTGPDGGNVPAGCDVEIIDVMQIE